jgi:hypothetical protein
MELEKPAINSCQGLINGTPLNEPNIIEPPSYSFVKIVIPDKSYIILGDDLLP